MPEWTREETQLRTAPGPLGWGFGMGLITPPCKNTDYGNGKKNPAYFPHGEKELLGTLQLRDTVTSDSASCIMDLLTK